LIESDLVAVDEPPPAQSILSEGATGTFFSTDVALLNPSAAPVPVTLRFFREGQPELHEDRTLPARSRTTLHLDDMPGLDAAAVSTQVDAPAGTTIVAERLMSWDASGYGGHLGSAVSAPHRKWFFAEGAQGYFSTFFLLANSSDTAATVRFTFLVELGEPVEHVVTVPAASRRTFYAGDLAALVNRSFATTIETDVPIVAERAMYFGDSPLWLGGHGSAGVSEPASRRDVRLFTIRADRGRTRDVLGHDRQRLARAHNSFGITGRGVKWGLAEGRAGGARGYETYILISNSSGPDAADVKLTFIREDGGTAERTIAVNAGQRVNVNASALPELANSNFSTIVESTNGIAINVESSIYWSVGGVVWEAGGNTVATPIP
jgi:hypothetical protein